LIILLIFYNFLSDLNFRIVKIIIVYARCIIFTSFISWDYTLSIKSSSSSPSVFFFFAYNIFCILCNFEEKYARIYITHNEYFSFISWCYFPNIYTIYV